MAEQRSTLIIEISSEQARRNAQALDRELRSIQNSGNYASTSMNSMSVACRQLAGYMMGIVTVGTAISKMDEFTNLNNRLRLVTDTQKELTLAMKDTFDIAQRSGAAWGGTATIYQKIQYNSEKLGLSQIQVAKVTESISKSISNSGSSAQAASAALYQLGQAFDKSSLNGDEFVSMSENAGYLMEVFSKGLGVTRAELKEMSSDGQLTTDKMIQAIQKMSGSIEDDFGKTNFTIGQGFTQVSNAVTKFVGESGQATGAATAISGSLGTLAENLNAVTNIAMIGGAYWLGSYIPAMYASVVAGYAKAKQLVEQTAIQYAVVQAERVAAAQELAGAEAKLVNLQATRAQLVEELKLELARKKKQISDQGAINSEMRMGFLRQQQAMINAELTATENALAAARTRSTAAAAASMGVGRGLLGIMTGPVGLGVAVAGVAASMLLMRDNTNTATSALDLQKQSVDELAEAYSKMSMAKLIAEMDALKNKAQEAKNEANNALNSAYAVAPNVGNFGTEKQREQNKLLSDTIKELKTGSLDAAKALQELQKGGFTQDQLDKAQRYFATFEEQNNVLKTYNYQSVLTSSYLETASGLYDKTSDKISELTKSLSRLNETYEVSYAQILKGAEVFLQVAENSGKSKDQIDAGTVALQKYSDGKITATQLSQEFLKYNLIPENQIDAFKKQVAQSDGYKKSVTGLNVELKKQNELRNEFQKQHQNVIAMKKAETQETNKQTEAQTKLNQKQQDALNAIKGDIAREAYIIANMKAGFSRDKSEFYADYRSKAELGYVGKSISSEESATVAAGYKLKQQNEARLASEKAIEASQKKQTKELKNQESITKRLIGISGNSGIGTGAHLDIRYGGSRDGQKVSAEHIARLQAGGKSLSNYRVSSDYGQRKAPTAGASSFHKGIDFAMPVGTPITTKVAVKDVNTAYDSKGGGYYSTVTFEDGVVLKLLHQSPSMQSKVKGGASTGTYGSYAAQEKADAKTEQDIEALRSNYRSLGGRDEIDHINRVKDLRKNGLDSLIADENARFEKTKQLRQFEFTMEIDGWRWVGEEKIKNDAFARKLRAEANADFDKKEKADAVKSAEEYRDFEINEYRKTQQLKIAEYQLAFSQPLTELQAEVLDMQAKANMGGGYGAWALQNQYGKDLGSFGDGYEKNVNSINEDKTITDDAVRKQMLLQAEESFRLSKLKLNEKYTLLEQDLAHAQYESQMSQYSQMISIASDTWGRMTSVIKDAQGENSAAYKAMFFVQQTMAAAQAVIYANVASAAALAPPPIGLGPVAGMPLSGMIKGSGYANAALIMAQGLAGMAHNGIDNIPKEGTWLLDGGERVLNPQQNKDLTNYLSGKPSNSQPIVNVHTLPGTTATATTNADGSLDLRIQQLAQQEVRGAFARMSQNQNSYEAKQTKRAFNVRPNRK